MNGQSRANGDTDVLVLHLSDPHARAAIRHYAYRLQYEQAELAADLLAWIDTYEAQHGTGRPPIGERLVTLRGLIGEYIDEAHGYSEDMEEEDD